MLSGEKRPGDMWTNLSRYRTMRVSIETTFAREIGTVSDELGVETASAT